MIYNRLATEKLKSMAQLFPLIALTGPRQSGKTTLLRNAFENYRYVSLENPQIRAYATQDPEGFLKSYDQHVIFDEIQLVPELFSYLQQVVDEANLPGQFILSGSQNFLLLERISQSLAGRVYLMDLLPLSASEKSTPIQNDIYQELLEGGYPRLTSMQIAPHDFFSSYIKTYIERDVRTILKIQDLSKFRKFILLLAHQAGQLLNATSLAKKLSLSPPTIENWISILEASYLVFRLNPWHANLAKRQIKSSKLYFYDTGLLCHLLGIRDQEALTISNYKGPIFENFVLLEILKQHRAKGLTTQFAFFRDQVQHEIDLVIELNNQIQLIEMKASHTVKTEHIKALHYLDPYFKESKLQHFLINFYDQTQKRSHETILSWKDCSGQL